MSGYSRIGVCLSGDEANEVALEHAKALASAETTIVLVSSTWSPLDAFVNKSDFEDPARGPRVKKYLSSLKEQGEAEGFTVESRFTREPVHRFLERFQVDLDLVIMTSRGRSGLSRWARGSVSELVVKTLDCPVLVLKRGEQ